MADRGLAERIENRLINRFQAVAGIDQYIDASERGAAVQIIVDKPRPRHNLTLGGCGVAVTRQIDQHQLA